VSLHRFVQEAGLLPDARSFTYRMALLFAIFLHKEAIGSPKFPSYPCKYMPWSKTPVVSFILRLVGISTYLTYSGLLSSGHPNAVDFHSLENLFLQRSILITTIISISEFNTWPAFLFRLASYSLCKVGTQTSLLACWLSFS
jgi:hypothetical protein